MQEWQASLPHRDAWECDGEPRSENYFQAQEGQDTCHEWPMCFQKGEEP